MIEKSLLYPETLRPPPTLPDAASVLEIGFPLSEEEFLIIQLAMSIHAASRQPKLTWSGWHHIAVALAIGREHAKRKAGDRTDTLDYRRLMGAFLRGTGFGFLGKSDYTTAVRLLPYWSEIDAWRSGLSQDRQLALNNPRLVWDAFLADHRSDGQPAAHKIRTGGRWSRPAVSPLEMMAALEEAREAAEERQRIAEREVEYYAAVMQEVAKEAEMSDDDMARIRARVRAMHES